MNTTTPIQPDSENFDGDEINLAGIFNALWEYKWPVICFSLVSAFAVGLFSFFTPRQYKSEALILVSSPIVKPNSDSEEGAQVSEITLSSLDASTYKILAKSDELMFSLADTLKAKLDPELLSIISSETSTSTIANALVEDLGIALLQETGQRNVRSTTPLLVLSYQSNKKDLPPIVVNTWSRLFLKRNQGLSSNVTDDFYQNVVEQYMQAKNNLEEKENELATLDAASNELNRLKTQMGFKTTQLDSSLRNYQLLQTELEEKSRQLEYVDSILQQVQIAGRWIGYQKGEADWGESNTTKGTGRNLMNLSEDFASLVKDSVSTYTIYQQKKDELSSQHQSDLLRFEESSEISTKLLQLTQVDSILKEYRVELVSSEIHIDQLQTKVQSIQQVLSKQPFVFTTRKAIVDEALWAQADENGQIDLETQQRLSNYKLVSEQLNPIFISLNDSLAHAKAELSYILLRSKFLEKEVYTLQSTSLQLHTNVDSLRKERHTLEQEIERERNALVQEEIRELADITTELEVKRETLADYRSHYVKSKKARERLRREISELEISTKYYQENYTTWRNQLSIMSVKVDSLEVERRRIERDVEVYQESFTRLAKLQEEARIARKQAAGDIQIVSRSEISKKIPKNTVTKILFSIVLSLAMASILTVLYALNLRKQA